MSGQQSKTIIENFYHLFNSANLEKLFSLIADDIENEINYGGIMKGKAKAIEFMKYNMEHYDERVNECTYMISQDGRHITVKLNVSGKYIKTDQSNIPATGQRYELDVINYFEVENNQIIKAECYFDEPALFKQLRENS